MCIRNANQFMESPKKLQDIKVAVDAVIFGYFDKKDLQILLIKRNIEPFKGGWALPGGLVLDDESVDDAVKRELYEETDIQLYQVKQIGAYGKPDRDPRHRTLTVAYYGETDNLAIAKAKDDAKNVRWFDWDQMPALAFDHSDIVRDAEKRYIAKPSY